MPFGRLRTGFDAPKEIPLGDGLTTNETGASVTFYAGNNPLIGSPRRGSAIRSATASRQAR